MVIGPENGYFVIYTKSERDFISKTYCLIDKMIKEDNRIVIWIQSFNDTWSYVHSDMLIV